MTKFVKIIPILLSCFLLAWTAAVYSFAKYGDRWAIYPALLVFPLTILAHVWYYGVSQPRGWALKYALVHVPIQFVAWVGCLMLISKDTL
jgi:hypothetical protein